MAITRDTVLHIARLARLELSPEELDPMQRDLAKILEYFASLAELDTSSVPETAQVGVLQAPLREDTVCEGLSNELALEQAPRASASGFAVPAFVDES